MDSAPDDFKESKCFIIYMNEERKTFLCFCFLCKFSPESGELFHVRTCEACFNLQCKRALNRLSAAHNCREESAEEEEEEENGEVKKLYCFFFLLTAFVTVDFQADAWW